MGTAAHFQGGRTLLSAIASIAIIAQAPPVAAGEPPDIIVTGERVPRTLRETPASVVVATEKTMDEQAAPDRIEQVLDLIPNVQISSGGEGPTIRGLDTTGPTRDLPAFLGGTQPRTTLIVDGRAVGFQEFVFGAAPVWDVERIEVFRSPQTTTQGRNSISGAIFVHSNDPSPTAEFRARAIVGNLGTRQLSAVASGPVIADQLAMRVVGDLRFGRSVQRHQRQCGRRQPRPRRPWAVSVQAAGDAASAARCTDRAFAYPQ